MNGAYIFELKKAKVAEIRDGAVSWFDRNNELRQLHRLRTQQIHRCTFTTTSHPHFYSTPKLVLYRMHIYILIYYIYFSLYWANRFWDLYWLRNWTLRMDGPVGRAQHAVIYIVVVFHVHVIIVRNLGRREWIMWYDAVFIIRGPIGAPSSSLSAMGPG